MALRLNGSTSGYVEINAPAVAQDQTLTFPSGIIQVQQAVKDDKFTTTNSGKNVWTDIPGLSVSITPTSTNHTVLITVDIQGSGSQHGALCAIRCLRGSTVVGQGSDLTDHMRSSIANLRAVGDNNGMWHGSFSFIDNPSTTSSTTYKLQGQVESGGFFINRTYNFSTSVNFISTCISTITAMEVA